MHTTYSDGHATHREIAKAAIDAGIDVVIVTDHNVYISGVEGYYEDGDRRVLMLVGEEIHDQARDPQKNHLLVFGAGRELSQFAPNPQLLLDAVKKSEGLAFLAHPVDPAAPAFGEPDISWVDWDVRSFTGIELWNGMSEFKGRLKSKLHGLYYAYFPHQIARGPYPEAVRIWDNLLNQGKRVVAIGGSDAHAIPARLGPLRKTLFPYEFHFRSINTHLLTPKGLTGDLYEDRRTVLDALRQGHAFIGYDLPGSTQGFRFSAKAQDETIVMGDQTPAGQGVTFQIRLPARVPCRLYKDGKVIKKWSKRELYTYITSETGVYRVEADIEYRGALRRWIVSNPIYLV